MRDERRGRLSRQGLDLRRIECNIRQVPNVSVRDIVCVESPTL